MLPPPENDGQGGCHVVEAVGEFRNVARAHRDRGASSGGPVPRGHPPRMTGRDRPVPPVRERPGTLGEYAAGHAGSVQRVSKKRG